MRALLAKQEKPSLSLHRKNALKYILLYFSNYMTRISTNEAHVSSSFTASFHPFSLKFGKSVAR